MSTANGALTPPQAPQDPDTTATSPPAAKRKRSTSQANALQVRDQPAQKPQPASTDARTFNALLEDVLEILKRSARPLCPAPRPAAPSPQHR